MEIKYFQEIRIGATFVVDGEAFIKRSELIFTDSIGMERYIDPLFDIKIGKMIAAGAKAAALPTTPVTTVTPASIDVSYNNGIQADATGHVILSDGDVERIARRVAEILKGQ